MLAEVCDKAVGDRWMPGDGPVWLLNPTGFPWGLAVLTGGLILAGVAKGSLPAFTGAAFVWLYVVMGVASALVPDKDANAMWLAMQSEGCVSTRTELMNTGVLAAFALAYMILGFRARYRHAKTA